MTKILNCLFLGGWRTEGPRDEPPDGICGKEAALRDSMAVSINLGLFLWVSLE